MKDIEAVKSLPAQAIEAFGRLDIVVNNAGIAPAGNFLEQDDSVWEDVFAINVTAPALLAKVAGRHMVEQGSGKIINIASTSGILGKPLLVAYSSSKGAVLQMTKALAGELARKGVQVNAIAPGAFATDAQRVRDLFIEVTNYDAEQIRQKVFYLAPKHGEHRKRLSFEAQVPLWKGQNRILVVARENGEVMGFYRHLVHLP